MAFLSGNIGFQELLVLLHVATAVNARVSLFTIPLFHPAILHEFSVPAFYPAALKRSLSYHHSTPVQNHSETSYHHSIPSLFPITLYDPLVHSCRHPECCRLLQEGRPRLHRFLQFGEGSLDPGSISLSVRVAHFQGRCNPWCVGLAPLPCSHSRASRRVDVHTVAHAPAGELLGWRPLTRPLLTCNGLVEGRR